MILSRYLVPLLAGVLLAACAGTTPPAPIPPPVPPTSPSNLWLLTPGSWTEYQVYTGAGTYNPTTGVITVTAETPVAGEIDRITCLPYQLPEGLAVARIYSGRGVTTTAIPPGLSGVLVDRNNGQFLGEAANVSASDINPPEPLLSISPVSGGSFTVTSAVAWQSGGALGTLVTRYWTVGIGLAVDGFTNVTETALIESPGTANGNFVGNYFYDGGTDVAEMIYGTLSADMSVQVTVFKRVGSGAN